MIIHLPYFTYYSHTSEKDVENRKPKNLHILVENTKKPTRDASPTPSRSKLVADGVECKNPELGKSIAAWSVLVGGKMPVPRRGIDSIGNPGV